MNELVPLFGAMIITLVVLAGLVKIFSVWMKRRDDMLSRYE
ncbi:MAG: hypothetical protein QNJ94_17825 [Alphaproteobacteria bacterium]|nr:hypothetical protein [Alphaproteobacteria bacterium]